MRIAIVGAGAIGCFLAARLSQRGHVITLVGREEQAEAMRRDGLLVRDARDEGRRYWFDVASGLAEHPGAEHPELVLLAVKTQDVASACAAMLPAVAGVPVVALQNGVRADDFAAAVLGKDALLGAVVMCAITYQQPGEISVQFPGWLILGEPYHPVSSRTRAIARVLSAAVPTSVTQDLMRARWTKLIFNLNNGLCAATGLTLPEVLGTPNGRLLAVRVMREGARVARVAGIRLDHGLHGLSPRALAQDRRVAMISVLQSALNTALVGLPERAATRVLALAGRSRLNQIAIRGSTWQSIARGKASEIEYLNGEVVRRGGEVGVPTPYNAHLVHIVHGVERARKFVGIAAMFPPGAV